MPPVETSWGRSNNAAAGVTLAINAEKAVDLVTGFKLSYALKDATGKADTLSVAINALDDGKDSGTVDGVVTVTELEANSIESIAINSDISGADTTKKNTDYTNTVTKLSADAVKTITVTGDANLTIGGTAATFDTVTKIDASAATGKLTVVATGATASVQFLGGNAADTYTASGKGDTINAGKGADNITLAAGNDTIIIAAGDSVLTAKADGFDTITNFTVGVDTIDLGAFGFTGQLASALATRGALANSVVDGTTLSQADFFNFGGVDRGVAVGTNGGFTYVFVDVNKDGDFTAAADLVIKLAGAPVLSISDFGF
jgi:Ca2+-binding RTX toxin-like protein